MLCYDNYLLLMIFISGIDYFYQSNLEKIIPICYRFLSLSYRIKKNSFENECKI